MSGLIKVAIVAISTILTACHSGSVRVEAGLGYDTGDSYHQPHHHNEPYESIDIVTFGLVDSYGINSELSYHDELTLDPTTHYGTFEIYWDVRSYHDYTVNLYINDYDDLVGATTIGADYCGPFEACDNDGMQVCEYSIDGYLGCGIDLYDAGRNANPIDQHLYHFPEQAFLSLEACPTKGGYCELKSIPVWVF